jgi:predicted DsbA family dithiol-disulfide isomerase
MTQKKTGKAQGKAKDVDKTAGEAVKNLQSDDAGYETEKTRPGMNVNNVLIVLLMVSVVALAYMYTRLNNAEKGGLSSISAGAVITSNTSGDNPKTNGPSPYGTVKLEFYVMSQCPYGTQVEDAIKPVLDTLGNSVDFSLNYIASETSAGAFSSLHGPNEVTGDKVQLCAAKYSPDKYMDMIVCQNKDASNMATNWESCAAQVGIDTQKLQACLQGSEGSQLLSASIKASQAAQAGGSPTIYVNGNQYQGARDSASFLRALCAGLTNNPACANIPACSTDNDCTAQPSKDGRCVNPGQKDAKCEYTDPVPVELIVVNSADCTTCDPTQIVKVSQQLFPGLKVRTVEYSSDEGKTLTAKYGITMLPAYLFDSNVIKTPKYAQVKQALLQKSDKYLINPSASGSTYNPTLVEVPKKLDLYVMSHCPYGVAAEQNLKTVLELFGDKINFSLYFIASESSPGTFTSLHGQAEVDEDLRQVCAMKHYPADYFKYVLCVDEKPSDATIWQSCAQNASLDVNTLKTCAEGSEGKQLLSDNIKSGNDLGIGSSPTFMVNGKYQKGGAMPANDIKNLVCQYNAGLSGCDKTLAGASPSAVPASGGCGG